jgi:hypothetical protein
MAEANEGGSRTSPDVAAGQRVVESQRVIKTVAPEIVRGQFTSTTEPPTAAPQAPRSRRTG